MLSLLLQAFLSVKCLACSVKANALAGCARGVKTRDFAGVQVEEGEGEHVFSSPLL